MNKLILSGGLGNQIFQLVAAHELFSENEFQIDIESLKPSVDSDGLPDIAKLRLKQNNRWVKSDFNKIQKMTLSVLLKYSSITPDNNLRRKILRSIRPLMILMCEGFLFRGFHLAMADGIGACKIKICEDNNILVGNFHSFEWFDCNQSRYRELLQLQDGNDYICKLTDEALIQGPLVVHIRLGDFTLQDELNITTQKYFTDSIHAAWSSKKYRKIWLFSNEVEKAKQFLPESLIHEVVVVDTDNCSPAEILEIMKLGTGYIISNSTFGWWAATLSRNQSSDIYIPSKWYKTIGEPKALLRPNWTRINTL